MKVEKEEKVLKLYSDSIKENITKWIEEDIILPDTKPDAIKIVTINVNPYITNIEVLNESIKLTGRLNYFIIYKANDTEMGIRGVLHSSQFTQILNVKDLDNSMLVTVDPVVKNVIFALPNERKISVKTEVIFKVNGSKIENVPFIENFKNLDGLQTKVKEDTFNNIIETKCETITSREDILLPDENSDFGEILKVTTKIVNEEYKQSYNKLLVKGDIKVRMLYLSEKNVSEVKVAETLVPFTSMVEFSNIRDDSLFDIRYSIKDFNIKANTEITSNKTVSVDYQILLCAIMYEKSKVSFVEDFYSDKNELEYETKEARVVKSQDKNEKYIEIKSTAENVISKDFTLIDYDVDLGYLIVKDNDKDATVEGNIKINLLSENLNNSDIDSKIIDIPVSEKIEFKDGLELGKRNTEIKLESISIDQNSGNLNIKINLKVITEIENIIDTKFIDEINIGEINEDNLESMSIYIVKPKDTLWSIAKKYKTTVEKITAVNNIENPDLINVNQKLLIIR